jgi:hypothetical protein
MESRYQTGGSNSCKTIIKSSIIVSNQNSRSQNRPSSVLYIEIF